MISSISIVNVESNDNVIYINNATVEMINTKFNHNTTVMAMICLFLKMEN